METPGQLSQLRILQRQYFQLVEPQQLRWPDEAILKRPQVQTWLFTHLLDASTISSPPPVGYQLRFLKELVARLERSITDPEEDVWSPISSFCSLWRGRVQPGATPEHVPCIGRNACQPVLTLCPSLVTGNFG